MRGPRLVPDRTAFLDRDGTINVPAPEGEYVRDPAAVELLPGAAEAIRILNDLNIRTVVVTNQRGVSLGVMTEGDLTRVNGRLLELLEAEGAVLDAIYHCPHASDSCDCRKPGPGMFKRAERELTGVRIEGAAMIGDSRLDIEAGKRLGLTTVRIGTRGSQEAAADHEASSLLAAVEWLTGTPTQEIKP